MKTEDLIAALAADVRPRLNAGQRLARALPGALLLALAGFWLFWGVRPDMAGALGSVAALKTLLPLALAVLAGALVLGLARPEGQGGRPALGLWALAVALVAGFAAAFAVGGGASGLIGALATPSLITCLVSIPVLSLPPLVAALWALSAGAPRRPAQAGALAGLLAGGLAAGLYSFYCDQDAVLFFLPAYGAAIAAVMGAGGLIGARALRW